MEFAAVKHQRRNQRMMGELAPSWRPKTRPTYKLKLNLKKLLNPRLDSKEVTVLDDVSSEEKPEIDKVSSINSKETVIKAPYLYLTKSKESITVSGRFKYQPD